MEQDLRALKLRIKLGVAAAFLGGWFGVLGWLYHLSTFDGDTSSRGWTLVQWGKFAWQIMQSSLAREVYVAAAVGAGVMLAPLIYLFFFRKG